MKRQVARATILLPLAFILVAVASMEPAFLAQHEQQKGIFGRVTSITTTFPDVFEFTLDTAEGEQRVESTPNTRVSIPGRETTSASDVSLGDFLAVLAREDSGRLNALSVMVKPDATVSYSHFMGSVAGVAGDQVSLIDKDGNLVTADLLLAGERPDPGQIITALVHRDAKTAGLTVIAAESGNQKIERLAKAIQQAIGEGASDNQANLENRLKANATGHLTILQEIHGRVVPELRPVFALAQVRALQAFSVLLKAAGLGNPTVKLSGVIEQFTPNTGIVLVSPDVGPQVELKLTPATVIRLFGKSALPGNLEETQKVESIYDPQTDEAHTLDVIFPALDDGLEETLLAQVQVGELEGTIAEIGASSLKVRLPSHVVTLVVTRETVITDRGNPAVLFELVPLVRVKVRFDPFTRRALEIETYDDKPGLAFVSGVVKSFVPKTKEGTVIPGRTSEGNTLIISPSGEIITLNVTSNSIIERAGLRMTIHDIKVGDLVRPTSRYVVDTLEVQKLTLKSPELQGVIRGKVDAPGGGGLITISTEGLLLLTVTVLPATEITRGTDKVQFNDLVVGDRVVSGRYNLRTRLVSQLFVQPSDILRAMGTISELDTEFNIVTLAPDVGELLIPNKPGIIIKDANPRATFSDLMVGDKVLAVFYKTGRVVVRIIVESQ